MWFKNIKKDIPFSHRNNHMRNSILIKKSINDYNQDCNNNWMILKTILNYIGINDIDINYYSFNC